MISSHFYILTTDSRGSTPYTLLSSLSSSGSRAWSPVRATGSGTAGSSKYLTPQLFDALFNCNKRGRIDVQSNSNKCFGELSKIHQLVVVIFFQPSRRFSVVVQDINGAGSLNMIEYCSQDGLGYLCSATATFIY